LVSELIYVFVVRVFRAAAFLAKGMYREAVEEATQALGRDATYPKAYLRRARAYKALRQYPAAAKDYRKCLTISSNPSERQAVEAEMAEMERERRRQHYGEEESHSSGAHRNSSRSRGKKTPKSKYAWDEEYDEYFRGFFQNRSRSR
jgi:tetratricopeptide (TPR) repeat protein